MELTPTQDETQRSLYTDFIDLLNENQSDWIYGDDLFEYHNLDKRVMVAFLLWAEYLRNALTGVN